MNDQLLHDALRRLDEFEFKKQGDWLRQGRCPSCNKRELYTHAESPWVIKCGRLNHCGYEIHLKELYPDLFNSWSERYPVTPTSPTAAADAYLAHNRGFDLGLINGTYTQESYFDHKLNAGSATVRFEVGETWWERIIDQPERFGKKKANFKYRGNYAGEWFCLPSIDLSNAKKVWLVEGIFDAIALAHHDHAAVALMSCNNYPAKALEQLLVQRGNKPRPVLVWALDGGNAGKRYIKKWVDRAQAEGWPCQAAYVPVTKNGKERDWSDLHLLDKAQIDPDRKQLTTEGLKKFLFYGALLVAQTALEKAMLIHENKNLDQFEFDFSGRLYWFKMDIERYHKALDRISEEESGLTQEELRERAMQESGGIREIANCVPTPLYYQENKITDESWYYYKVEFPHDGKVVKNTFTSSQLSTSSEFKKRLLGIAPGAVYTGTNAMLEQSIRRQLFNIKRVETVDFIGYTKEHQAYVLGDVAVAKGQIYPINDEDYFDIGRLSLKSLNKSVDLTINTDAKSYKADWVRHLVTAFGAKGLAALSYWMGSLFAEQIRETQKSFPFLEVVGEAGAGKSTLIEFMWKLLGRLDYEGFDPSKATNAGRARNFSQVSGLPIVLIESDRESSGEGKGHVKSFDWDELKTAYNGRSIRARGMATGGNETYEPPFRGSVVISQNNAVDASEAVMSRIVHLTFDRSTHNATTRASSIFLERVALEDVSGFILACVTRERQILEIMEAKSDDYHRQLMSAPEVRNIRIAKNHGQLMALADALRLVIKISDEEHAQLHEQIKQMAIERQHAINADHPVVDEFWDIYEYLNGDDSHPMLNHSRDAGVIALNLNHFMQMAMDHKQQVANMRDLKKLLKGSRRYKYLGQRVVNSGIKARDMQNASRGTSERCWVFENKVGK